MRREARLVRSGLMFGAAAVVLLAASAPVDAQRGGAAQPQIQVGGLQIVKVAAPKDDTFARPFHTDNGTTMVLWIRMPAGMGLIDIDEDASVIETFGDDKGTDLGGRFGSFPDTFKDGSGGLIDITSTAQPAAGATRLTATGTVAVAVASGTKPQRVANLRLENGRTFKIGTGSVTVDDVKTEDENLTFLLKLPRQAMETIKELRFLDARNQPIEGRIQGRGYSGNDAEMYLSVPASAKTITLELDVWQGRRELKVPFKVQATVSLGG